MKRLFSILITVSMVFLGVSAHAAPFYFEPFPLDGKNAFEITENYSFGLGSAVKLQEYTSEDHSRISSCEGFGKAPCLESMLGSYVDRTKSVNGQKQMEFSIVAPVCNLSNEDLCIEGVSLYKTSASPVAAQFIRSAGGPVTPKISSHGIPAGGTVSLWKGSAGSGLENVNLVVYALLDFVPRVDFRTNKVSYNVNAFSLEVRAYEPVPGGNEPNRFNEITPGSGLGSFPSPSQGCVWQDETGCGKWVDLPEDVRISVALRSDYKISNFLNGRLKDPQVSNLKQGKTSVLKVDAQPVKVPQIAVVFGDEGDLLSRLNARPGFNKTLPYYDNAFKAVNTLREFTKDRASGENVIWRISAMGSEHPCYENVDVAGLVVTNATTYEGQPPTLVDGYLEYKVAGMHHLSNGSDVFEGSYDLAIQSDVARCFYGYSKAPISATVTVVGTSGEQKVATTQVREKDGWLTLSAYGFTFSENKVRVKISQASSGGKTQPVVSQPGKSVTTKLPFLIPKFSGTSTTLNASQRAALNASLVRTAKSVTCTGFFEKPADSKRALSRAKSTCSEAKKLVKGAKISTRVARIIGSSIAGAVEVRAGF